MLTTQINSILLQHKRTEYKHHVDNRDHLNAKPCKSRWRIDLYTSSSDGPYITPRAPYMNAGHIMSFRRPYIIPVVSYIISGHCL